MTFLEFVCERLLGPPAFHGGGEGDSYWCCPFHDDSTPSFHTMPHKPEFKDRWKCFGCADARRRSGPLEALLSGRRLAASPGPAEQWRNEWKREARSDSLQSLRGPGIQRATVQSGRCVACKMKEEWQDHDSEICDPPVLAAADELDKLLGDDLREEQATDLLDFASSALKACTTHGIHPTALAGQLSSRAWVRRTERQHAAECEEPYCDWRACRLARGWTEQEISRRH